MKTPVRRSSKSRFLDSFKNLLPDTLSDTSIELDNPETSTLLFIGETISRMSEYLQSWYDGGKPDEFDDVLIDIVAEKYNIEW
jgi:hypothetical protein